MLGSTCWSEFFRLVIVLPHDRVVYRGRILGTRCLKGPASEFDSAEIKLSSPLNSAIICEIYQRFLRISVSRRRLVKNSVLEMSNKYMHKSTFEIITTHYNISTSKCVGSTWKPLDKIRFSQFTACKHNQPIRIVGTENGLWLTDIPPTTFLFPGLSLPKKCEVRIFYVISWFSFFL